MITKLRYDSQGKFELAGNIDIPYINFEQKNIDNKNFFQLTVSVMINLKKNVLKQLADDNKITGDERIEVIKAIDKFLILLFSFAIIISKEDFYTDKIQDLFEIRIDFDKMKYIKANGILFYKTIKNITDYDKWIDVNIIAEFKKMIAEFNENGNKSILKHELIILIYNAFILRYRMEYI